MTFKTTAYVASTLPVAVLNKKLAEWGVAKVVLLGKTHLASYVYLQQRHPTLKLKVLPASFVLGVCYLLGTLLWLKLSRNRLVFFHECCNPIFDVLVKVIKPRGDYYPQVTLTSFSRVDSADIRATKLQKLFRVFGLESWFEYYCGDLDNNEGFFYVQAVKAYPASIIQHKVSESRSILAETRTSVTRFSGETKIVLLCSRDVADDLELKKVYSQVIELASSFGFTCYLKDHPAIHSRLNLLHENALVIDSAIPMELIEDDFTLVIGVASTGLLYSSKRAVSIIKLISIADESVCARRIAHLVNLPEGNLIQFPDDFEELRKIFLKTIHT